MKRGVEQDGLSGPTIYCDVPYRWLTPRQYAIGQALSVAEGDRPPSYPTLCGLTGIREPETLRSHVKAIKGNLQPITQDGELMRDWRGVAALARVWRWARSSDGKRHLNHAHYERFRSTDGTTSVARSGNQAA